MGDVVAALLDPEHGHFLLESGYHASAWLDLETLFLRPARIEPLAIELANRIRSHGPEVICGPLVEGAFVALLVARTLDLPFVYTERIARRESGLYPYAHELPAVLRSHVAGKRVAIVNDVISAGSAVGATAADLLDSGAHVIAIGALLILGDWTRRFAAEKNLAVEALSESPFELWKPEQCPLCARDVPLQRRLQ